MDDIDILLTSIIERVTKSSISEAEKADIYANLSVGMRRLVWPILLAHTPEYLLKELKTKKALTIEEYIEIIESALQNPGTTKEFHDELKASLFEVDTLLRKSLR